MDPKIARRLASRGHRGQRTRFGEAVIEHLRRVAAAVPPEAQPVAWLHDLLEMTSISRSRLRASGLTVADELALDLLAHRADESYDAYVLRIADAAGRAGLIARMVKLADLDDHLAHNRIPVGAPPYAWARRCMLERLDAETSTAVAS